MRLMDYRVMLRGIITLCVIGFCHITTGAKPETYKIVEHQNLLVVCNATSDPSTIIYWTKNDTKSTFFQNGTKLELIDVTRREAGDYVCHALNTSSEADNGTEWNRTVQVVKVDVLYPAEFLTCSVSPTTILANATYSVYFNIVGNPDPKWEIRNNRTMAASVRADLPASGSLGGVYVRCGDDGFIACTGFNYLNHGVNTTGGAYLTVLCGPEPDIYVQTHYTTESFLGVDANFTMHYVGNPKPTLTWTRDDGHPIPWTRVTQVDTNMTSMLKFTNVQVSDFTDYTLTMRNKYNTSMAHFRLNPTGPPQRPADLEFYDVTYDSVMLRWTSGFDMGSPQYYQVFKFEENYFASVSERIYDRSTTHGIGQIVTYVVTELQSDTFYNLSVEATNDDTHYTYGFAQPHVTFTTPSRPDTPDSSRHRHKSTYVAVGTASGVLGLIAVMAFVVYLVKYRKMRTGYKTHTPKPCHPDVASGQNTIELVWRTTKRPY